MSGRKNVIEPTILVSGQSLAANYLSQEIGVDYLDNVGIILSFTGAPTGSFYIEFKVGQSDWSDSGLVIPAAGAADVHNVNLNQVPYEKARVRYVRTSGTGSLTVTISAKAV